MTVSNLDSALVAIIPRLAVLTSDCGRKEIPGIDEVPEWQDFSERETTNDQLRIEEVIVSSGIGLGGALLHIGIGNSGLAQRLGAKFNRITGITIQQGEIEKALGFGLPNYTVSFDNKHVEGLAKRLDGPFDVIVDNNPTTFCCCRAHLIAMMENFNALLAPGGMLLTDRKGLRWTTQPNDPQWGFRPVEWVALGALCGLQAVSCTDFVIGLRRPLAAEGLPSA